MLINCVAYQDGRKLADIPVEDISDYVSRPDCFVWVALADPSASELSLMQEEFGLHELAVEDARASHQRPKLEEYGDMLFCVMRTIERGAPPENELIEGQVSVFVGKNYVLSVRQKSRQGFASIRARSEREPELLRRGSGYVFYALMDTIVDRYFPILDDLETRLEALEQQMFKRPPTRQGIEEFYSLKQELMTLRHAVSPLAEVASKLYGGRVPMACAGLQEYFRDVFDHCVRLNAEIESMREMLQTAISVSLTLVSIAESEITKKLAAWGALITVPTLIAGVYGMNFEKMPELHWAFGYPFAIVAMSVIDGLLWLRFRKVGWV
ncbi:MAG: magnesium/cobalt transporter CorA [Proteobacteria bacterium]|nr:magnesium/cobalt transporter CorA [Pseudomonadota bacterium]